MTTTYKKQPLYVTRKIPAFPLKYYGFPVDRLRHWIALRNGAEFTAKEASEDVADISSIDRLQKRGEIEYDSRTKRYREIELFDCWLHIYEKEGNKEDPLIDGLKRIMTTVSLNIIQELKDKGFEEAANKVFEYAVYEKFIDTKFIEEPERKNG